MKSPIYESMRLDVVLGTAYESMHLDMVLGIEKTGRFGGIFLNTCYNKLVLCMYIGKA